MRACGLSTDTEDVDNMFYSIERYAFPLTQRVPVEYNGAVLRIHTDGLHPGYVRLINPFSEFNFYPISVVFVHLRVRKR